MAATHALPPAPLVQRPRVLIVGSAFASAATVMVFIGMVGIYLAQRSSAVAAGDTWLPQTLTIPLQQPNTMLFTLAMSVVTMQWAVSAVANNDKVNSYLALGVTMVFGVATIIMTTYLWSNMGADVFANVQSVLIYTITGAHVLMLVIALIFMALMTFRALAGGFNARQHDGITAAAIFWYATVAVYVLIWISIYVTK
jgi:heme/copper-type cytochrome/quinol oxidase subunit 3